MRGHVPKKQKKIKRQRAYHSSSEDEDEGAHGATDAPQGFQEKEEVLKRKPRPVQAQPKFRATIGTGKAGQEPAKDEEASSPEDDSEQDDDEYGDEDTDRSDVSEDDDISETSTNIARKVRKRNDPEAFATSISKILGTKLTSQKRSEPILSRSKAAQETNKTLTDQKLTLKAHRALLAEKKAAQEKARVKDVLGLEKEDVSTEAIVAEEKRLRRTAQKGVIKLFNAVRAAQVKAEQAEREAKQAGVIGVGKREEKIKEMSKQGFLDMITGGAKKKEGSIEA
jgi:mitochondrial fusion and transport protein UGO1